jgi:hypothetical protein
LRPEPGGLGSCPTRAFPWRHPLPRVRRGRNAGPLLRMAGDQTAPQRRCPDTRIIRGPVKDEDGFLVGIAAHSLGTSLLQVVDGLPIQPCRLKMPRQLDGHRFAIALV